MMTRLAAPETHIPGDQVVERRAMGADQSEWGVDERDDWMLKVRIDQKSVCRADAENIQHQEGERRRDEPSHAGTGRRGLVRDGSVCWRRGSRFHRDNVKQNREIANG